MNRPTLYAIVSEHRAVLAHALGDPVAALDDDGAHTPDVTYAIAYINGAADALGITTRELLEHPMVLRTTTNNTPTRNVVANNDLRGQAKPIMYGHCTACGRTMSWMELTKGMTTCVAKNLCAQRAEKRGR